MDGVKIKKMFELTLVSILFSEVSSLSFWFLNSPISDVFSNFEVFYDFLFFVFLYSRELRFLDGGFLDLVVFGFRFWNLKPSYKFLNKSNYPLPLPLRIKIVCPDFTISTHYTSCFTITLHTRDPQTGT